MFGPYIANDGEVNPEIFIEDLISNPNLVCWASTLQGWEEYR
jgi:hypothetical protein